MSSFCGIMIELPTLRIDRFDDDAISKAEAFFLSHCHTDHMVGLGSFRFQKELLNNDKYLYCSSISATILAKKFPTWGSCHVKVISLNSPYTISLKDRCISVTAIPAGHCPGSIMFLFETESLKILYTGDYRINVRDITKFRAFYEGQGRVKTINKIYLDTTFFLKLYERFPTRESSLQKLITLIKEWISKSNDHTIKLITSAKYGYEYVFKEIYDKLHKPVCVNNETFEVYSLIPELDEAVTTKSDSTQIHSTYLKRYTINEYNESETGVRIINMSAIRWQQGYLENGIYTIENGIHQICYSTHASYEEGLKLLEFLKPKEIYACVDQRDSALQKRMFLLIEECLNIFNDRNSNDESKNISLFKTENTLIDLCSKQNKNNCDISDDPPTKIIKLDNILDSPPR